MLINQVCCCWVCVRVCNWLLHFTCFLCFVYKYLIYLIKYMVNSLMFHDSFWLANQTIYFIAVYNRLTNILLSMYFDDSTVLFPGQTCQVSCSEYRSWYLIQSEWWTLYPLFSRAGMLIRACPCYNMKLAHIFSSNPTMIHQLLIHQLPVMLLGRPYDWKRSPF